MTRATELFELTAGAGGPGPWAVITEGRPFRAGPAPFGASAAELRHLDRDGTVVLLLGDAYAPADVVRRPGIRGAAAELVVPGGAVLAGVAAAWVHGVGGPALVSVCGDPGVDVISPPGLVPRPKSRDWLRVRQFALERGDRVQLDGLAVTSPVRTALDVARLAPPDAAVDVLRRLALVTGVEPHEVERRLERMATFRGLLTVRRAVTAWRLGDAPVPAPAAPAPVGQSSPVRFPVTR